MAHGANGVNAAHSLPARPTVHFFIDTSGVGGGFNAGGVAVLGLRPLPRPAEGFTEGNWVLLGGGPVQVSTPCASTSTSCTSSWGPLPSLVVGGEGSGRGLYAGWRAHFRV